MTWIEKKRTLSFVPKFNTSGKHDATGAFIPEAHAFKKHFGKGSEVAGINNRLSFAKRREQVVAEISKRVLAQQVFDDVALFCHGWVDGIQLGFKKSDVKKLAKAVSDVTSGNTAATVVLYCCSTGDDPDDESITAAGTGDGSFADALRDELCAQGLNHCRVVGHTTVAHTTSNPHVVFFDGMGSFYGGNGGYPPVAPRTALWAPWRKALRDRKNNTLRFRMPFMTVEEIHAELSEELVS